MSKQNVIAVSETSKRFIQDLKEEFGLKSDGQSLEVILTVATKHRFETRTDDGNIIENEDGTPKQFDRFVDAVEEIQTAANGSKAKAKMDKMIRDLYTMTLQVGGDIEALRKSYPAQIAQFEAEDAKETAEVEG